MLNSRYRNSMNGEIEIPYERLVSSNGVICINSNKSSLSLRNSLLTNFTPLEILEWLRSLFLAGFKHAPGIGYQGFLFGNRPRWFSVISAERVLGFFI